MKRLYYLVPVLFCTVMAAQQYELPVDRPREQKVEHTLFTLSYNEGYELASYAAWQLTPEQANSPTVAFKEKFDEDPMVATGTSDTKDYKNAGFIMGQLVPPEDMFVSIKAVEETFLMSNVVPQKPAFNKYVWKVNEQLVREWAKEGHTLYVVAGPVLSDAPFGTFGKNKVSIIIRYYKAVLDTHGERAIGFLYRNNASSGSPKSYALSINELEEITGMDFFTALPDDLEEKIESDTDFSMWNFDALKQ